MAPDMPSGGADTAGGSVLATCGHRDPHVFPGLCQTKILQYSDLYPYSSGGKTEVEKGFLLLLYCYASQTVSFRNIEA